MVMSSLNCVILVMSMGNVVMLTPIGEAVVMIDTSSPGDVEVVVVFMSGVRDVVVIMVASSGDMLDTSLSGGVMVSSDDVGMVVTCMGVLVTVVES